MNWSYIWLIINALLFIYIVVATVKKIYFRISKGKSFSLENSQKFSGLLYLSSIGVLMISLCSLDIHETKIAALKTDLLKQVNELQTLRLHYDSLRVKRLYLNRVMPQDSSGGEDQISFEHPRDTAFEAARESLNRISISIDASTHNVSEKEVKRMFDQYLHSRAQYKTLSTQNGIVDSVLKSMVAYKIPKQMEVLKPIQCSLVITKSTKDSILFEAVSMEESSLYTRKNINVSSRVKAALIDPTGENFKIQLLGSEEQLVNQKRNTSWRWEVTPLQSGADNTLVINLTSVVQNELGKINYDVPITDIHVNVKPHWFKSTSKFMKDHWELFLTPTVLISLLVYFRKKIMEWLHPKLVIKGYWDKL